MSALDRENHSAGTSCRSIRAGLVVFLAATAIVAAGLALTSSDSAAQSADTAQKAPSAAGNAQHGKAVYDRVGCYECHGRDAQSGQVKIGPNPLPFEAFRQQIRSPRNDMPPYTTKVLSDADVADIYAFVQS